MPPTPPSQSVRRPHTVRTIILTVIATLVVLFILTVAYFWPTSRSSSGLDVSQGRNMLSYATDMMEGGVAGKAVAPSVGMMTQASPEMMPSPIPPIDTSGASIKDRAVIDAKIIRTGNLNLRVDDAEKRMEEAKALAKQLNGFVASSNISERNGVKTGYITVRVPSDKYDTLVAEAKKLAVLVLSESSDAEDVTAQFVDLNARLKSAQSEEEQYLNILKQAKSVEDTLKVTQALNEVRSRIEQMQGQLRYMTDRTDYSTLNISLTEETKIQLPTKTWKPLETIRQAFQGLIESLQGLVDFLIALAIYGIGFILPIILLVYLAYRLVRWFIGKLKK